MISPALLQGAPRQAGLLDEKELIQSPLLAGEMQKQQQEGAANLPAIQAAAMRAKTLQQEQETAAGLPAIQAKLYGAQGANQQAEAEKQQILNQQMRELPTQLQGLHAIIRGESPSVAGPQNPATGVVGGQTMPQTAPDTEDYAQTIRNVRQFLSTPQASLNPAFSAAGKGTLTAAQEKLWASIQPEIDEALNPPPGGFNPLNGARADAINKAVSMIPAELGDYEPAQKHIGMLAKEGQNTVFNPMYAAVKDMTSARGISETNTKPYMTARNFWSQGEKTYKDYLEKGGPASPGAKSYQQGILDKFVGVSLQKSPTEAQIRLTQSWPGFENYLSENKDSQGNFLGYNLKTGVFIPENVLSSMMDVMRDDVSGLADNVKQNNASIKRMAGADFNPDKAIIITDEEIDKDLARIPKPAEPKTVTGGTQWVRINGKLVKQDAPK